jgi:hypothetical protein
MSQLFAEESSQNLLRELKKSYASQFYPFSREQISEYKSILDFSSNGFLSNEHILWDLDLFEELADFIEWDGLYSIKNFQFDLSFIKMFESRINFRGLHFSKNVVWNDELINAYGDRFDWNKTLLFKQDSDNPNLINRFQDLLDWDLISRISKCVSDVKFIHQYQEKLNWKELSKNRHLPLSVDFVKENVDKIDFRELSKNPAAVKLIFHYPKSSRWAWRWVIVNPGIVYTKDVFEFVMKYFEPSVHPLFKNKISGVILRHIFSSPFTDKSPFLIQENAEILPWDIICENGYTVLPDTFFYENIERLKFNSRDFISRHKHLITKDFLNKYSSLFDWSQNYIWTLPIDKAFIEHSEKVDWWQLSWNQNLDWSLDFLIDNLEKFNLNALKRNKAIYEQLFSTLSIEELLGE